MEYIINVQQREILGAIFAGVKSLKHRKNLTQDDRKLIDDCIKYNFEELDQLKTPFIIQNKIIAAAENKKNLDKYFSTVLENNNIQVQ